MQRLAFFLHIPFPLGEIFTILSRREELLRGLLGGDLVAFQTRRRLQWFRSALLPVLGIESKIMKCPQGRVWSAADLFRVQGIRFSGRRWAVFLSKLRAKGKKRRAGFRTRTLGVVRIPTSLPWRKSALAPESKMQPRFWSKTSASHWI